jgi:hypothetical protein
VSITEKHPLPWVFVLNLDAHDCNGVWDASGKLVMSTPYSGDNLPLRFMVAAVNRQHGPPICGKCDKPSGGRLGHWCEPCTASHIKEIQADMHLYQSAEKRASREADFNKDT